MDEYPSWFRDTGERGASSFPCLKLRGGVGSLATEVVDPIYAGKSVLSLGLRPHWWKLVLSFCGWSWGKSSCSSSLRSEFAESHSFMGHSSPGRLDPECSSFGDKSL